jgi:hypothetical protein
MNARSARLDCAIDVVQALASTPRFRTFVTILVATELIHDLRGRGPWVVLAPSEDVFNGLPRGWLDAVFQPANVEALIDLAENHLCVAAGPGSPLVTLLGEHVSDQAGVGHLRPLANGALIEVERLLLPPSLRGRCAPSGLRLQRTRARAPIAGASRIHRTNRLSRRSPAI